VSFFPRTGVGVPPCTTTTDPALALVLALVGLSCRGGDLPLGLAVTGNAVRWHSGHPFSVGQPFSFRSRFSPRAVLHVPCEEPCLWPLRSDAMPVPAELLRNVFVCLKWCSARPASVNMLLVHSWHVLLPDRFLQSNYFGAKRAWQPESQVWEFTGLRVLKGAVGFSP